MADYQQRVYEEHKELHGRLSRLVSFVNGDIFKGLPAEDRDLLTKQMAAMTLYLDILNKRIERFTKAAA